MLIEISFQLNSYLNCLFCATVCHKKYKYNDLDNVSLRKFVSDYKFVSVFNVPQ